MSNANSALVAHETPRLVDKSSIDFPPRNQLFECHYQDAEYYCAGQFSLSPLVLARDIDTVHRWVNMDYARYWGMQGTSLDDVTRCYQQLCDTEVVYAGFHDGELAFLVELYDPQRDMLRYYYPLQQGDLGMHILLAPAVVLRRNFSRTVFLSVMDFLFSLPKVERIVVEPDARNEKIHRLNRMAGFVYHQRIYLPHKIACLATATVAQYRAARACFDSLD